MLVLPGLTSLATSWEEGAPGPWLVTAILFTVAVALGGPLLLSWYLTRLPADHFVKAPVARAPFVRVLRGISGALLIVAGAAMLALPGPGIASIVVGLVVLETPLLRRAAVSLLRRPRIAEAMTERRRRAGLPPFELPPEGPGHGG